MLYFAKASRSSQLDRIEFHHISWFISAYLLKVSDLISKSSKNIVLKPLLIWKYLKLQTSLEIILINVFIGKWIFILFV